MPTLAFLIKRFVAQRLLGFAVVVALAFTIGVLVAGPIYADAAREAILSSAIRSQSVVAKNLRFTVYGAPSDSVQADDAVRAAVASLPTRAIVPQILSTARLRAGDAGALEVPLLAREGSSDHLVLVGTAPGGGEIALSSGTLRSLHLGLGNRVTLVGPTGERTSLRVSGSYAFPAPGDPFWYGSLTPFPTSDVPRPPPVLLSLDGLQRIVEDLGLSAQSSWDVFPDFPRLPFERAEQLPTQIDRAVDRLGHTPGFSSLHVTTGVPTIVDLVTQRVANLFAPVLLVVFQIGAVALAVLLGVGSLVLTRQSFELAVLRSRGFSRGKLLAAQAGQALISAGVALPLGLLLGLALARLASNSNGPTQPGVRYPISLSAGSVMIGLVVAFVGAGALLLSSLPHLRRTILEERRLLSREDRPLLARFPVELVALPLGLFAFEELRRRGVVASFERGSFDPLVLLAPTLLIFGLSFLALRLLLVCLRLADGRIRRTKRLAAYLAARRLARSPGTSFATSLLLLLSVGLVLVSSSYRAVVARSHEDGAHQRVGADWAVAVAAAQQPLAAIAGMPAGTTPVVRSVPTFADQAGLSADPVALGVDPGTYAEVGWWRADYSDVPLDRWLAELRMPSPAVAIPDGGTLALTVDVPTTAAGLSLVATVETELREVAALRLGTLEPGTHGYATDLDGARSLLALALVQEGTGDLPSVLPLALRDASVAGTPLDLSRWEAVRWRGSDAEVAPGGESVGVTISPGAGHVVGGIAPPAPPLPALVSPGVAATQPSVFEVTLGGQRLELRRVAIAEHFPSASGDFVVVSAPALLEATVRIPERGLALGEVWAKGADPRPALRGAGFVVGSSSSTRPIVGYLSQLPQSLAVGMFFTAAVGGLGLVVIGVAVGLYFAQRRREFEFASLRALGTEPPQIRRTLALEQGLMVAFAVGAGGAIGYLILRIMMPYVGESLATPFPQPLLALDGVSLIAALVSIGLATAVALSFATRALLRASVTSVLRGEAE